MIVHEASEKSVRSKNTALPTGPVSIAVALGLDDETGSIRPGKRADLLLVDGDPLREIDLIDDPEQNFLVIMKDGVVQQVAPPLELYERPANRFVAGFIGSPAMNFLGGRLVREDGLKFVSGDAGVALPAGFEPG